MQRDERLRWGRRRTWQIMKQQAHLGVQKGGQTKRIVEGIPEIEFVAQEVKCTVLNHSIRQALWPVTSTMKFWFHHITIYRSICKLLRVPRPIFGGFGPDFQRFCCDPCDVSSNWEGLWPVTAKLNDLVQYPEREAKWAGEGENLVSKALRDNVHTS